MVLELATPGIWYPGQSQEEFDEEVEMMLVRSKATQSFLNGEVNADFFLNFLHESGVNVFEASEEWNLGELII